MKKLMGRLQEFIKFARERLDHKARFKHLLADDFHIFSLLLWL